MMRAILLIGSALLTLAARPASAQTSERQDPHVRNDCRLAAQIIRTGNPSPHRAWAYEAIRYCEESGPDVLVAVWRTAAPENRIALMELVRATGNFNDMRIVNVLAEVFGSGRHSDTTRIYAGVLLYSYAVPGIYLDEDDLLKGEKRSPAMRMVSHDTRADNTRATLGDLRSKVFEVLTSVATAESGGAVGNAARTMVRLLRRR